MPRKHRRGRTAATAASGATTPCVFPTITGFGRPYEEQVRQLFACSDASFVDLSIMAQNNRGRSTIRLGSGIGTQMQTAVAGSARLTFSAEDARRVDNWAHGIENAEADLVMVGKGPVDLRGVVKNIEAFGKASTSSQYFIYDGHGSFNSIDVSDLFPADCSMVLAEVCHPMPLLPLKVLQLERDITFLQKAAKLPYDLFVGGSNTAGDVRRAKGTTSLLWFDGPGDAAGALHDLGQALKSVVATSNLCVVKTRLIAVHIPYVPMVCTMATRAQLAAVESNVEREVADLRREMNRRFELLSDGLSRLLQHMMPATATTASPAASTGGQSPAASTGGQSPAASTGGPSAAASSVHTVGPGTDAEDCCSK